MPRVLIADDVAPDCTEILRKGGLEVDDRGKMKPGPLKADIKGFEGLIVRSGVQVTGDIIEAAPNLKIIGRAGVGVDNIDTETATRRGIIVVNAPLGNVVSAAEHTFGLMLACARNTARGDGSMRAGRWDRKKLKGVELEGKTLGIVGLGKIGSRVAGYAKAFGMKLTAFDPVIVRERAERLGVEVMDLDALVEGADFITVHVPLSDRTRGMFGAERFKRMKKTARIVNTSRGGVIDEKALAEALDAGEIAGAALDVFEQEPPEENHPLRNNAKVTMTPHLAASSAEAQWKVAVDVAHQFVDYFRSGGIRSAVNLAALSEPSLAPYMRLAKDLGGLAAQLAGGKVRSVRVTYRGEIAVHDLRALTQSATHGALRPTLGEEVNVVNASVVAKDAGIEVSEKKDPDAGSYRNLVTVEVKTGNGPRVVSGTIIEGRASRIVSIDGLDIDLTPARHMLCLFYEDVPGVVGKVGTILGEAGINIARMEVGRTERGKKAMIMLTLDEPAQPAHAEKMRTSVPLDDIRIITLP